MNHYDDELTVRDARAAYFAASGFAADGGYGDRWVFLKAGTVTVFAFPNTAGRVRAVRFHDLHHVLTGYDTTWTGEAEIAAWELAAGCARHYAAWVLNIGAAAIGLFIAPRQVARAFARGRRSRSLYREQFSEELLEQRVGELRARLNLK
jgi:hypothetical protein